MATTKKKTTAKKAAPKKIVARKAAVRRPKAAALKSFYPSKENAPFMTFKVTDQTVYWSIFLIVLLLLALWVLKIQIDVSDLINSIKI